MHLPVAAADPLGHVKDAPLFSWGEGDLGWQIWLGEKLEGVSRALMSVGFGKHVFILMLAGALTLLLFWIRAKQGKTETVPGRFGNLLESIMLFLRDQVVRPFMGEHGDRYLPFVWGFFFLILINNILGLIPIFDYLGHGGNTATANIGVTAALALCSFSLYHYLGIKEQGGVWVYTKNIFPHVPVFILPIIVPVEIIAHLVRPAALAIRLCANMVAGHTLMAVILGFTLQAAALGLAGWGSVTLVSCVAVIALTFLELQVAMLQAFVFTFLSTVFLSLAVHPEH